MARFVDPGWSREDIDATVGDWVGRCLLSDDSLLYDSRAVWTDASINGLYDRFLGNPLLGAGTFEGKFVQQLEGADDDLRLCAAELVLVHFLFATSVGQEGKLRIIRVALEGSDLELPDEHRAIDALDQGIGNPGIGYNTRRDLQLGYLIDWVRRFKAESVERRRELLEDPWGLREFSDDTEQPLREMRHILLHLLRPEEYERISSGRHKARLLQVFGPEFLPENPPEDLDHQLLAIREALDPLIPSESRVGGIYDYYWPPLVDLWRGEGSGDSVGSLESLRWKKQIVLYGPPGTGKTYEAQRLAGSLIRAGALQRLGANAYFSDPARIEELVRSHIEWLQLHPAYSYEEFIRGLRIEKGQTVYRDGLLLSLIERINACKDTEEDPRLPTVLVLDEINRADLSRLLGEALSLLEADKRGQTVTLPGLEGGEDARQINIPSDLYVIATMNEIDQSVETLDYALRRRFLWTECRFDRDALLTIMEARWSEDIAKFTFDELAAELDVFADNAARLNELVRASSELGSAFEVGHSYFADLTFFLGQWLLGKYRRQRYLWESWGAAREPLHDLWDHSIGPLLAAYLAGADEATRMDELAGFREALLAGPS